MGSEALSSRLASQIRLAHRWPKWPMAVAATLGALLIVQIIRLIWVLVMPLSPLGSWTPPRAAIVPMAERPALFAAFDPFFRSASAGGGQAVVTSLGLTLFGTNMNEATGGGSAIIAGEDGIQSSFSVGEEIVPGVRLAAVAFDHVLLDRGGVRESLFLDQSVPSDVAASGAMAPATPVLPPPTPEIGSVAAQAAGELSPDAVRAGIGFAPNGAGGRVTGLVVQPRGDGAAFRAAGLQPGDIIRSVNGRSLSSPTDAAAIASQMTPGARLSFEVERGGSITPVTLFLSK